MKLPYFSSLINCTNTEAINMRITLRLYSAVLVIALSLLPCQLVQAQTVGFDVFTAPLTPGVSIPAGSTYAIKWNPSPSPVGKISLLLLQGSSNTTFQVGPTIASGIDSATGSYDWKVPASPSFPFYGLKLQLDSDPTAFQYSTYFSISGSNTAASSPPATTVHSTTATVQISSQPTDKSSSTLSTSSPEAPLTTSKPTSPTPSPSASSTNSSSSTILETSAQTSASANPSPSASASSAASNNDSLSTGAKAGIAIGAVVGAGIFALLAYIAFLLRKRNTRSGPVRGSHGEGEERVPELGPGLVPEMDGKGRVGELDATKSYTSEKATTSHEVAELG